MRVAAIRFLLLAAAAAAHASSDQTLSSTCTYTVLPWGMCGGSAWPGGVDAQTRGWCCGAGFRCARVTPAYWQCQTSSTVSTAATAPRAGEPGVDQLRRVGHSSCLTWRALAAFAPQQQAQQPAQRCAACQRDASVGPRHLERQVRCHAGARLHAFPFQGTAGWPSLATHPRLIRPFFTRPACSIHQRVRDLGAVRRAGLLQPPVLRGCTLVERPGLPGGHRVLQAQQRVLGVRPSRLRCRGAAAPNGFASPQPARWPARLHGFAERDCASLRMPPRANRCPARARRPAASDSSSPYREWDACGGLSGCSPQYCADAPWANGKACPGDTICTRYSSHSWRCVASRYISPPASTAPRPPPPSRALPAGPGLPTASLPWAAVH
jgi:hypothetical protein